MQLNTTLRSEVWGSGDSGVLVLNDGAAIMLRKSPG